MHRADKAKTNTWEQIRNDAALVISALQDRSGGGDSRDFWHLAAIEKSFGIGTAQGVKNPESGVEEVGSDGDEQKFSSLITFIPTTARLCSNHPPP